MLPPLTLTLSPRKGGEREYQTNSPHTSYSSAFVTRACTMSPGFTPVAPLRNTEPSISGASHLERPMAPSSSTSSMMTSMVWPTLAAVSSRAHLLLRRHEAVPALLLHLVRHRVADGVGGGAFDRLVLEAADARELRLLQPVEQELEILLRLAGEADDEGRADGEIGTDLAPALQAAPASSPGAPAGASPSARAARHAGTGCRDRAGSCPPPSAAAPRRRADRDRRSAAAPRRRASPAPRHRSRKRALSVRPFHGLSAYLMSSP